MLNTLPEPLVIALEIAIVMFSAIIHELAHGYTAYLCGDPTAKEAGRLTLNPLKHLDPFGSIILPFCLALLHAPVFGFAKPVPFDPRRLKNPRKDSLMVAFAGPLSNFFQAVIGSMIFRIIVSCNPLLLYKGSIVLELLMLYVMVNLILCFFNLIPLPPLDGSHIFAFFLHGKALYKYYQLQRYSMPILFALLFLVPWLLKFDPISWYFNVTAYPIANAFLFSGILS